MADIAREPTGVIIRIWSPHQELLESIERHFKEEELVHESDIISVVKDQPTDFMYYCTRMGNLELFGWMVTIAGDLEAAYSHDDIGPQGQSIRIGLELVF